MSAAETIFPYDYADDLDLQLSKPINAETGAELQGVHVNAAEEYGAKRIDMADSTAEWNKLVFEASFSVDEDELTRLVSAGEKPAEVLQGMLSIRIGASKTRFGVRLEFDGDRAFKGKLELERSDVAGLAAIVPELVRIGDAKKPEKGKAAFAGASVAWGPAVEVVLDRFASPYNGPLKYHWDKFAESEHAWLRDKPDDVYYLDARDVPTLYLNLKYQELHAILQNKARTGSQAAVAHAASAAILHPVTVSLIFAAVASMRLEEGEEEGEKRVVLGDGWRGPLASALAGEMFSEEPKEQALASLYAALRDPDRAAILSGAIGTLAHRFSKVQTRLDRAGKLLSTVQE
jgi:hypothetical protein